MPSTTAGSPTSPAGRIRSDADRTAAASPPPSGATTAVESRVPGGRAPAVAALAMVVLSIAVRLWALIDTPASRIDGDQAVTGIMVQRILSGQGHYAFYAGQQYNGSLEQYLQAGLYWLLPVVQNAFTLRLPQVALAATATWLMYLAGRRLLHRPWAAVIAAGLFAVGPFWTVARGLGSYGSYPDLIVVGLVAVYAALRLRDGGRAAVLWSAVCGFCVGLIAWLGLSGVELLFPAGLIAAPYYVRSLRLWLTAVPAAVVGVAPLLWWSVRHGVFALSNAGPAVQRSTVGERFQNLFGPVLREFIGVGYINGRPGWPMQLQYLAVVALGVAYVVAVVRHRHGILSVVLLRTGGRSGLDALLVSVPLMVLSYSASKWAWFSGEPRYLYAFTPVLLWCLAAALPERPGRIRLTAVLAGCAVFAATSLSMLGHRPYISATQNTSRYQSVVDFLRNNGDRYGYAEYWTAMPLLYLSNRTMDIASTTSGRTKFPDVTQGADEAPTTFYVAVSPGSLAPNGGRWMEERFKSHGVKYRKTVLGALVVFDRLSPDLKPWQLKIGPGPLFPPKP